MRRIIIIIAILGLVIGLSLGGYIFLTPKTYSVVEDPTVAEVLTVETDTIIATVNAAGRLEAIDKVDLTFDSNGKVATIYVTEGDRVEAGDLLAELEATELTYALQLAEIDLTKALLQLEQLQLPPALADLTSALATLDSATAALQELKQDVSAVEVRAAEVALSSARANLQKVLSGPNENALIVAAANLRKMEVALQQAQAAYDKVAYDPRLVQGAAAQLEQATIDYESARANYNLSVEEADNADILAAQAQVASAESNLEKLTLEATPAQIAAAQAQIAQAEASLQKLLEGPSDEDLILAQGAIEVAQINFEKATYNLEQTKLWSPITGTVTAINIKADTAPNPNEPAISIADLAAFKLVVEIDEIDINRIAPDQPVVINLDSLPEEEYNGHVDVIGLAPVSNATGGIVAYPVTIIIDSPATPFKIGMNVNVIIETERLEDVVVVANRAIEIDRQTGQTFVEKQIDEQTIERTEVVLGRRSNTVSQILEGLVVGDQVIIRERNRRDELRRTIQGEDE